MMLTETPRSRHDALDECALIRRIRNGDDAAFEVMVDHHRDRMRSIAQRFFRCDHERDDAVQEAFISALRGIGRFDQQSSLATWLHRITVNVCLMKLRSSRRHQSKISLDECLSNSDGSAALHSRLAGWSEDPHATLETSETREQVRACIGQLPDSYRTILLLRDIEELDTQQTAQRLNCSDCNAKTRLHRARRALRTLLEGEIAM